MKITIFGSRGNIGSRLVKFFRDSGYMLNLPEKGLMDLSGKNLGNVIYCAGLTADFRTKTYETIEAHVSFLNYILKYTVFESLLYFSSTRIYKNCEFSEEDTIIPINPSIPDGVYNISKLLGESLCLNHPNPRVRVIRLSNVIGTDLDSPNFLNSIFNDCIFKNKLILNTSLDSEKDYVYVYDILKVIEKICFSGQHRLYNISQGKNLKTRELLEIISEQVDFSLEINRNAGEFHFPPISNRRIKEEFSFQPSDIKLKIKEIVSELILKKKRVIQ